MFLPNRSFNTLSNSLRCSNDNRFLLLVLFFVGIKCYFNLPVQQSLSFEFCKLLAGNQCAIGTESRRIEHGAPGEIRTPGLLLRRNCSLLFIAIQRPSLPTSLAR